MKKITKLIEKIIGKKIDDAEKILLKEKIEYEIKKKYTINKKPNIVVECE